MRIKQTEIEIIQGDITSLDVAAVVNAANNEMIFDEGLAKVIAEKGGEAVVTEAQRYLPLNVGEAVITTAGDLSARNVIHAAVNEPGGKTTQENLRAAIASALVCAEKMNLTTLAFPALGCGAAGFPAVGGAKILLQEIFKVCQHTQTCLEKIQICLFDKETFTTFNETITGYLKHLQETLGPGPYVTTDVIIEMSEGVILIERSNPPYGWALPGGFLDYGESLEECAAREAMEETNMKLDNMRQLHTYSEMGRDPRFQTISTVFVGTGVGTPQFGDDAKGLKIVPYDELPKLDYAFDHGKIISDYLKTRTES